MHSPGPSVERLEDEGGGEKAGDRDSLEAKDERNREDQFHSLRPHDIMSVAGQVRCERLEEQSVKLCEANVEEEHRNEQPTKKESD